ncbi:hypothetical protein BSLG_010264 [Batrachochytrium salamandrivorans]|nr:hypothetical protein BSLG_010264 [Batrachochytrium salamandrivorans]
MPDNADDMDPFEINQLFLEMLKRNLSASQIHRISSFAYQFKMHYVVLFQGLMCCMDQATPLSRLNLFYVVDVLCKQNVKYHFDGYVELARIYTQELVESVVDCIRRKDGTISRNPQREGTANIGNVRKVLSLWRSKDIVPAELYEQLDTWLLTWADKTSEPGTSELPAVLTKDAILRRMEEDRERQKKSREDSWLCPPHDDQYGNFPEDDPEFQQAWEKPHTLTEADLNAMQRYRDWMDLSIEERADTQKEPLQSPNTDYFSQSLPNNASAYQHKQSTGTDSTLPANRLHGAHRVGPMHTIPQKHEKQPPLYQGYPPQHQILHTYHHPQQHQTQSSYNLPQQHNRQPNMSSVASSGPSIHNSQHHFSVPISESPIIAAASIQNIPSTTYSSQNISTMHPTPFQAGGFAPRNMPFPQALPTQGGGVIHSRQQQQQSHSGPYPHVHPPPPPPLHQPSYSQHHPQQQPPHPNLFAHPQLQGGPMQRHSEPIHISSGQSDSHYSHPQRDLRRYPLGNNRR